MTYHFSGIFVIVDTRANGPRCTRLDLWVGRLEERPQKSHTIIFINNCGTIRFGSTFSQRMCHIDQQCRVCTAQQVDEMCQTTWNDQLTRSELYKLYHRLLSGHARANAGNPNFHFTSRCVFSLRRAEVSWVTWFANLFDVFRNFRTLCNRTGYIDHDLLGLAVKQGYQRFTELQISEDLTVFWIDSNLPNGPSNAIQHWHIFSELDQAN